MSFSEDFLWGVSSTAYQIEGATAADGKVMGICDVLSTQYEKYEEINNTTLGHYYRYKEDISLMKQMRMKAYRFSVSWSRIMPEEGKINEKGVLFYLNLVNELCKAEISPICTLYDWNLPSWIQKKGGWMCSEISDYFEEYVTTVVHALSKQVSMWITMNEPSIFIGKGYLDGMFPPFETCTPGTGERMDKLCRLTKNILLAHGKAVQKIRKYSKSESKIGVIIECNVCVPQHETNKSIVEAQGKTFSNKTDYLQTNWWMGPIIDGKVQKELSNYITKEDLNEIYQKIDFLGCNSYMSNNFELNEKVTMQSIGIARTATDWPITPEVLYWTVRFYYEKYKLPIMITENGMANIDFIMSDGMVHDQQRIEFLKRYLKELKKAVDEEYPVIGYLYWSILDTYEWVEGYDKRFGLIYVDYGSQKRIPKDSAIWYAQMIKENGKFL